MSTAPFPRMSELPLWRLLVALDDAERTVGPDSPTARVLARAIQERLRARPKDDAPGAGRREEAAHASN
jgi:hypothetical protein